MSEVYQWDTTAANNNDPPPDGWPENQGYNTVNNCAREMMAAEARDLADKNGTLLTTGSAALYSLTSNRTITALFDGLIMGFRCHVGNAGAATTLNLNGLGAANVELPDGDAPLLVADGIYLVVYDAPGGRWQVISATTPEDALPTITVRNGAYTLTAAEFKGDIIRWTGSGNTLDVPAGVISLNGLARFITFGTSFDLTNNTGAIIYRTDSATPIPNGGTVTLSGEAYTLLPGTSGMILADFLA